MRLCMSGRSGRVFSCALLSLTLLAGGGAVASAQTTVTLNHPKSQVVWATVRGGSYANKNDQSQLATRSADNVEYERRALLKFDTQNTIPEGSHVTSALLTVTVKEGSDDATRRIGAYQVTQSWTETEVTWKMRRDGQRWNKAGVDLGSRVDDAVVSNKSGTKVTFDITPLVKAAVAGDLGSSRYTRIALVDLDSSTSESYHTYFTPNDSSTSARPVLKVTYGGSAPRPTPTPTPQPASSSSSTLRVLHWNTHHGGVGTDGKWDPERLVTWIAKFKPDVISLNEMERKTSWSHNTDEPADIAKLLKERTGRTWYYKFQTLSGSANGIGCMVLSRFPLHATGSKMLSGDRSAVNVGIDVNGRTINFTSTHLHPDSASYRKTEVGELTGWERGIAEQRIVAGDFNAGHTSSEMTLMKQTYYDSWAEAQAENTDISYAGNAAGNTRHSRIDYIYFSHGAKNLTLKSSQVFDTRDDDGIAPSDHKPLMSIFTVK
jgi:endonuclease/exonuclease/phosphatase family metal-dependent hydrolase